jgi:hypothetical protein
MLGTVVTCICQYVQVVKLNEQMLSIIAMVLTLNPQVHKAH